MNPIQISNLSFGYSPKRLILSELNLCVPEASIYGFLGHNGAGKSTTIRSILGLLSPDNGQIHLWGKPLKTVVPKVYRKIGTLVESPSFYPHLSAIDNLRIIAKYQGVKEASRLTTVLDRVGLFGAKNQITRKFSTGMKQRLGLAMAMLANPSLLILDEPTNGLDPTGISEIRQLLQQLNAEGTTIFLSSHLLSEVEKIATHIGILRNGKLAFEGSMEALQLIREHQLVLKLRVSTTTGLPTPIQDKMLSQKDNIIRLSINQQQDTSACLRQILAAGIDVFEASQETSDLEHLFFQITNNPTPDASH